VAAPSPGSFEYLEAKIRRDAKGTLFGRDFEWVCQWYLEHAPLYRGKFRRVWRWAEWPDRWGPDCGIDLVAETHEGKLWAIQAKAVGPEHSITKAEINSFLSESNRPQVAFRLLIGTTDNIGANARRTIDEQAKHASVVLRGDLVSADIAWPTTVGGAVPKLKRAKPKPHQRKAISDVLRGFRKHDRGRLIMACGTGKTLTGLWIHERLKSRRTLLLVPSISLVQQNLREWGRHAREDFDFLVVCSDESVASDRDDPALRYIAELGIDVTTDAKDIAAFLAKRRRRPAVVIATYQSSERVSAGQRKARKSFDLALCDEAHRLVGDVRGKFATVLDDRKIRCRRRLFMTATPRYFTQRARQRAADQDLEVASMDDPVTFGPEFHVLKFYDAITAKPTPLLTDYRVVVIGVTNAEAARWVEEGKLVRTREGAETDARTLAAQIGLAKAMREYDLHRVITFHRSIRRASRFVDAERLDSLPAIIETLRPASRPSGKLWARHISGETPASKRASMLRALADLPSNTRGLIANCACLGEGVDVPALDGIAFIDSKSSVVDIIQAVGRAIRLSPGKALGTIVITVFVEDHQNADEVLDSAQFKTVWEVLNALRAHDQRLADYLDTLRLTRSHGNGSSTAKLPPNVEISIPNLDVNEFEKAFCARAVTFTTQRSFEDWVRLCQQWCRSTLSMLADIKAKELFRDVPLGRWVSQQRVMYRSHRLFPHQVAALERLGMVWTKKVPRDLSWAKWLELCDAWCDKHGSLASVVRNTVFQGRPIGRWLGKQRARRSQGHLPSARIQALEDRGIAWNPHDDSFERGLAACDKWISEGNTLLNCGRGTVIDGFRFAKWIHVQRKLHRDGKLAAARVAALNARGMAWDPLAIKKQHWNGLLREYVSDHGSLATVAQNAIFKGRPIGRYLNQRRRFFKAGSLSQSEIDLLNAMGMVWSPLSAERQNILQMLRAWKHKHGSFDGLKNTTVVQGFRLGAALARWKSRQRMKSLDPSIEAALRELGVDFDQRRGGERRREIAIRLLGRWKRKHQTFDNLTRDVTVDGYRLGSLLQKWRLMWRTGKLDASLVRRLRQLGVVAAARPGRKRAAK
jgi:superfamily II DNA or RNA helicase